MDVRATASVTQRAMAASLVLLLVSCWAPRHSATELAVGTVVVIAGVAFAVAVAGSGGAALVLVPVLLMAGSTPGGPLNGQREEAGR